MTAISSSWQETRFKHPRKVHPLVHSSNTDWQSCLQACIFTVDQALDSCSKIGYPVMLKASWGGGGKGIRKCMNADDVKNSFKQVPIAR